ncbi:HAD family hydrolase [Streptomyces spiramyceticus]|uniref:HAD family hydrolase n=1 Tax=Streptomyces spiramyceticus TaxID=299717 RepID=UPI00237B248B|nr:HAD family hydrolase [Streptomyces spiramyceticus]
MTGQVEGRTLRAGRAAWLEEQGQVLPDELGRAQKEAEAEGRTVVFTAWDSQIRGALVVTDTVKATSAEAVADLKRLGLTPVLLTGDNTAAAHAVAAEVGIGKVIAEVDPELRLRRFRPLHRRFTAWACPSGRSGRARLPSGSNVFPPVLCHPVL